MFGLYYYPPKGSIFKEGKRGGIIGVGQETIVLGVRCMLYFITRHFVLVSIGKNPCVVSICIFNVILLLYT